MRSGFPVHRWRAAALRLALVCLLLACRPGGVRTDNGVTAKDPAGPIWDKGAAYRFDLHATALVDLGESWTAIHYELNSDLTISVVEERDGRTTLHLRLVEPKVRGLAPGGIEAPDRLSRDLREGDAVAVLAAGKMVAFGFRKSTPNSVVNTFRQLAAGLQVAVARGAKDDLQEEYDTTGRYLAAYTFDHATGTVCKTKVRYLALLGNSGGPSMLPRVIGSEGRIRVSRGMRLESVVLSDELAIGNAEMPIRAQTELELRLHAIEEARVTEAPASFLAGFTMVAASESAGADAHAQGLDRARTGGASFREIVSRMRAQGKARDAGLFNALAASLRTEAGAPAQAVRMVAARSDLSSVLVDGLGAASCPACESALIDLLGTPSPDIKASVLHALARFQNPGDRAVAAMKARLEEQAYDPTALYTLGAYARLFGQQGNPGKAAELGNFLVRRLERATDSMQKIVALRAIENAGCAQALSLLPRFTDDQDESVKGAAKLAAAAIANSDGRNP